jgi:peptide-methionine (S)-S-oxide reductase
MRKMSIARALSAMIGVVVFAWAAGLIGTSEHARDARRQIEAASAPPAPGSQKATLAAGCFWSNQAMFQQLRGVSSAVAGYSGGTVMNPIYDQVCEGSTGHAEAIQITYDPKVISFTQLLEVFWRTHDPTTLNRQGHDVGTQYRSAIFYHTPEQKDDAEQSKKKFEKAGEFAGPIVTEIVPFSEFYRAEAYHQDYYVNHPSQPYCSFVIQPKLEMFEKAFKAKLKAAPE